VLDHVRATCSGRRRRTDGDHPALDAICQSRICPPPIPSDLPN
jgi:hypothetical protein